MWQHSKLLTDNRAAVYGAANSLHRSNEATFPLGFLLKKNILKEKESKVSEGCAAGR